MADFYIRTFDLTKMLLALEKNHQDILRLSFTDPEDEEDEDDYPVSLSIESVCSSDPGVVLGDFVDSDDSLSGFFR